MGFSFRQDGFPASVRYWSHSLDAVFEGATNGGVKAAICVFGRSAIVSFCAVGSMVINLLRGSGNFFFT